MFFLGATAYPQPATGDRMQFDRIFSDQKVNDAFQDGEWFRLRMRYGILNASYATVMLRETTFRDQAVYHVAATGKTTGFARWFYKVDDYFDSYFEKDVVRPICFVRNISEGSYKRHVKIDFDHNTQTGLMHDLLKETKTEIPQKLLKAAALIAYHQPIPQSRLVELLSQKAYDYVRELAQLGMVDRRKDGNTRRLSTTRRFSETFGCPYTDRKKVKQWFREQVKTTGMFDGMEDAAVLKEESEMDGLIQSTLPLGEEE